MVWWLLELLLVTLFAIGKGLLSVVVGFPV